MGERAAVSVIRSLLEFVPLPRMVRVSQEMECPCLEASLTVLKRQLDASATLKEIASGATVAIGAGSRGIHQLPEITREVVRAVRRAGGEPFVFPSMGSHGGATAEGQERMLHMMGLTEDFLEAPIKSSMEAVEIGRSRDGFPVYQDRIAHAADWIIPINRIKPHTTFRGKYESGLVKMLVIGMGKQLGAEVCHALGPESMGHNLEEMVRVVLDEKRTLFGVAILENALHGTAQLEVLEADEILEREPLLLKEANRLTPHIPFDALDVLIIDEIGKDISGTGVDPNIIGRYTTHSMHGGPSITRVAALNLTEKTGGNANGLGVMDFITKKIFDRFSFEETYPNCLTSTITGSVKIPMVLDNDRLAIQAALKTCNRLNAEEIRFMRIRNTLELSKMLISENMLSEVKNRSGLRVEGVFDWFFDEQGNLSCGDF